MFLKYFYVKQYKSCSESRVYKLIIKLQLKFSQFWKINIKFF